MANEVAGPVAYLALGKVGVSDVSTRPRRYGPDHFMPAKDGPLAQLQLRLKKIEGVLAGQTSPQVPIDPTALRSNQFDADAALRRTSP